MAKIYINKFISAFHMLKLFKVLTSQKVVCVKIRLDVVNFSVIKVLKYQQLETALKDLANRSDFIYHMSKYST